MNEKARNNQYFATKACFVEASDTFLYDTTPKITQELYTRITDNFQIMPNRKKHFEMSCVYVINYFTMFSEV